MSLIFDDGASEYLELTISGFTTDAFTFSVWVNVDQLPTDAGDEFGVMTIAAAGANLEWFQMRIDDSGSQNRLDCSSRSQAENGFVVSTSEVVVGTWAHVCFVQTATNARACFFDGTDKITNTTTVTQPSTLDRLQIGCNRNQTRADFFSGRVAEVGIWNVALSDAQILGLAGGVNPICMFDTPPLYYFPLYSRDYVDNLAGAGETLTISAAGVTVGDHPPVAPPFSYGLGWQGAFAAAAGETITVDKWHPGIQQPYPHTNQIIPYQKS